MSNQVALQAKQPLLRSIHRQVGLVSDLLAHKIKAYREQSLGFGIPLDTKTLAAGAARHTSLTIKLSLGKHGKTARSPASLGLVVEYTLSVIVHSHGPIWVRIARKVDGMSDARISRATSPGTWGLLSEDGDLSEWRGDLWPSFWPMLMSDMERIVPDHIAHAIEDGDLHASVSPGKAFWQDGKCRVNPASPLQVWAFKQASTPATRQKVAEDRVAA